MFAFISLSKNCLIKKKNVGRQHCLHVKEGNFESIFTPRIQFDFVCIWLNLRENY